MNEIMETICNSIIAILTAISQFDITAVNPQKLAYAAQVIADMGRIVYRIINILIVIYGGVK